MSYILEPSKKKDKKWVITTPMGKLVHFGAKGYFDYTQHGDPKRKKDYINRHAASGKEQWNNPNTAGFWSRWLLWSEPTITEAISNIRKKFNIKIQVKNPL